MSDVQYLRRAQLFVVRDGKAYDLSALKFRFKVTQFDTLTPRKCDVRIYNPAHTTINAIVGDSGRAEYASVVLKAGYLNTAQFGTIFVGTLIKLGRGRERNTDTYLDLLSADNDTGYNFGIANASFAAGTDTETQFRYLAKQIGIDDKHIDPHVFGTTGLRRNALLRGKVYYGLARASLREMAISNDGRFFVENGVIKFVRNTGYLPGDIVKINSQTGMVGEPEATDNGINVTCLLNPNIHVGQAVELNNAEVNAQIVTSGGDAPLTPNLLSYPALEADDGRYRVIVHEMEGDTRATHWYSKLVCLDIDRSLADSNPGLSVKSFNQPNQAR